MAGLSALDTSELFMTLMGRPSSPAEASQIKSLSAWAGDDPTRIMAALQAQLVVISATQKARGNIAEGEFEAKMGPIRQALMEAVHTLQEVNDVGNDTREATAKMLKGAISELRATMSSAVLEGVLSVREQTGDHAKKSIDEARIAVRGELNSIQREAVEGMRKDLAAHVGRVHDDVMSIKIAEAHTALTREKRIKSFASFCIGALCALAGGAITYGVLLDRYANAASEMNFIAAQPSGRTMITLMRANATAPGVCGSNRGPQAGLGVYIEGGKRKCVWAFDLP